MNEYKFHITEDDFIKAQKYYLKKKSFKIFVITSLIGIVTLLLVTGVSLLALILGIILIPLFTFVFQKAGEYLQLSIIRKSYHKYPLLGKDITYRFTKEEYFCKTENEDSNYKYEELFKMESTDDYFLFYYGPKMFSIVPKRHLDANAISLLNEKVKDI